MIDFNSIDSLRKNGFTGFKTVKELWNDRSDIPKEKGVYLVFNLNNKKPEYINPGVGGFFKNRNPNISLNGLENSNVTGSLVVYIGKAGSLTGNATLYSRIGQYLRFGQGKKVGHWGGRLIWQLKNHNDLLICWKPTPSEEPRNIETKLISYFRNQFGELPFANLVG